MSKNHSDENAAASDPSRRVTMRDIAKELGVSHVTVSKAMRNTQQISEATRKRVLEKAEAMGYIPDPLLSSLSRYRRTSKTKPIQAELAWFNTWENPQRMRDHKEFKLYFEGAAYSAKRQGFQLVELNLIDLPIRRLNTILKTRNIQGILLTPSTNKAMVSRLNKLDWSNMAAVRFGHGTDYPKTHYVTSAQMMNTMLAFERAQQLGYQRIGFICEYWQKRYFSVGYSWAQKNLANEQKLPELLLDAADSRAQQQCKIKAWMKCAKPDAILTDSNHILKMLKMLEYRIPEDFALATTSIDDTEIDAGIDQRPFEIGRAAVRILTSLIAEQSFGIPDCLNETLIEGKWVDGSMMPRRDRV